MESINLADFAKAIERQYPGLTPALAQGYANVWAEQTEPALYEALQCWIDGKPVPNVEYGEMSIQRILAIRADRDELRAILLLSEYIRNPRVGKARIMTLRR